ncbi:MAG: hypothetical protein IPI23_00825 [Bacteroidetes bacterium]|nr:hypothetical protein [Bacteroidota bacterium]
MATIGWIDFSTNDRNRVGSVLDLLLPEGMVDELGMGTIRDALANQLFPGISTIQTRAKYFFIIPYILYDYQATKSAHRKGKTPSSFLEDREYEIMWALAEHYGYQEGNGVIGISKRKPNKIVRRPSAIYWNGLYTYQFINTNGMAADSFLRQSVNPSIETLLSSVQQGDDSTSDDAHVDYENVFKIKVLFKSNWKENLTLDLDADEAQFFQDRILSIAKSKLIAELLQADKLWKIFMQAENFMQFAKAALSLPLSDKLKAMLILAHDFSELMYGAHLAYNCQLHHKVFNSDYFDEDFQEWIDGIEDNMLDYSNFNPDILTANRESTKRFVQDWWKQTQNGFQNVKKRDALIEQQEAMVKGGKARLRWKKTDDVKESKWLGLRHFNYRFFQARTILKDIRSGINN